MKQWSRGLAAVGVIAAIGAGGLFLSPTSQARTARAQGAQATAFQIDPVHSTIVFRIKHSGVSYFYGTIHRPEGKYALDFETPSNSAMSVTAKVENIDTGNDGRDKHLKSPDFFAARQFPEISFVGREFAATGEGEMMVTGDLTMLGQTRAVEAHVSWVGQADTGRGIKSGLEAQFKIERSKWGMTKFIEEGALGDEVTLYVSLEGGAAGG